jgi:hypothetical protein
VGEEVSRQALAELRATTQRGMDLAARLLADGTEPRAGVAELALGQAVTGLVLGMWDDALALLPAARAGLTAGRNGLPATHVAALGLVTWLLGDDPGDLFADAVRRRRRAANAGDELLRDCVLAGEPTVGVAVYQHVVGAVPPVSGAEVTTPTQLAGWLCARLTAMRRPADWLAVTERVLRDHLPVWLERGFGVDAGLWLTLAYGAGDAVLTPLEAVLRGGRLVGAQPGDPLAEVLLGGLGDPVDLDLFAGFLAAVGTAAFPAGTDITVELLDHAPVAVLAEPSAGAGGLGRTVAAALATPFDGPLDERLASMVRGRLVASDGRTPLQILRVRIS